MVNCLKYLSSIVAIDKKLDTEIDNRIMSACASFGRPEGRLIGQKDIHTSTKSKFTKQLYF